MGARRVVRVPSSGWGGGQTSQLPPPPQKSSFPSVAFMLSELSTYSNTVELSPPPPPPNDRSLVVDHSGPGMKWVGKQVVGMCGRWVEHRGVVPASE
jgi:hypothetical protein